MQESHFEKLTVGQQIASLSCKPEVCHVFDKIWPPPSPYPEPVEFNPHPLILPSRTS